MRLIFIGCGDAFGSGGRLNTCLHVAGTKVNFLIDCGASSLIGLKARKTPLNEITTLFITHFHADHFGGVPFFMLDAQFFSKRSEPLAIVGPPGLAGWYERVLETAFSGSSLTKPRFDLSLIELRASQVQEVAGVVVKPFQVNHGNPGGPFFAYRFETENRTISYTGDTEWTDELIPTATEADLFIAEAYFFDKKIKLHLDLGTLTEKLPLVHAKRVVLTHMSDDMLVRIGTLNYETAHDGMIVEF
jgi:ribonuclease BN (tRNA processing enzyme)